MIWIILMAAATAVFGITSLWLYRALKRSRADFGKLAVMAGEKQKEAAEYAAIVHELSERVEELRSECCDYEKLRRENESLKYKLSRKPGKKKPL